MVKNIENFNHSIFFPLERKFQTRRFVLKFMYVTQILLLGQAMPLLLMQCRTSNLIYPALKIIYFLETEEKQMLFEFNEK